MFLPRELISHLYKHLIDHHNSLSSHILILVALEPDALCACRILTSLLKRDSVGHKIQPISGYEDLTQAGETMVSKMRRQNGGEGGHVICLGVGGLVDMSTVLGLDGLDDTEDPAGGVEVWLIDARRPWNLGNVFGGDPALVNGDAQKKQVDNGKILASYRPGHGGIIAYDDGDIVDTLADEQNAYCSLLAMGEVDDDYESEDTDEDDDDDDVNEVNASSNGRKRKSRSDDEEMDDADNADERPRRRRRSNSGSSIPSANGEDRTNGETTIIPGSPGADATNAAPPQVSQRALRRRFHKERKKLNLTLHKYYSQGTSYSEPISSILYSLAEELGREDNDMLWNAIVGVSSLELYGRSITGVGISTALDAGGSAGWGGERGERIRQVLRDEVQRLNPPEESDNSRDSSRSGVDPNIVIPTTARYPSDHAIRLSPEPRFLLIRHWSLYDSMKHSPYLGSRLHIWSEAGTKRLHKLLAKMGFSLAQCRQNYTHMDMDLKRTLRQRLLTYAPVYGLDGLVPPSNPMKEGWGFVKCWGWRGCFSAIDVGVIIGAILEVGKHGVAFSSTDTANHVNGTQDAPPTNGEPSTTDESGKVEAEAWIQRFWEAYDALGNVEALKQALPTAQHLHRAILRTGTTVLEKRQIRHLKAFRMAVIKEGPDVELFTHPSALTKLALWVGEAIAEQERDQRGKVGKGGVPTPLVLASLNNKRGVFVVVGTGGGGGVVDFAARTRRKVKLEERARKKEEKRAERARAKAEEKARKRAAKQSRDSDNLQAEAEGEDEDTEDEEDTESDEDDDDDDDEEDSDAEHDVGYGKNRFGNAFQEVADETNARVRIDSFENCVVEVKKEDLGRFLESLSMKAVVG